MKRTQITHVRQDKDTGIWYLQERHINFDTSCFNLICGDCCFRSNTLSCYQPKGLDCVANEIPIIFKEIGRK